MPMPNGGLITETNSQYYAGAQGFVVTAVAGQTDFILNKHGLKFNRQYITIKI